MCTTVVFSHIRYIINIFQSENDEIPLYNHTWLKLKRLTRKQWDSHTFLVGIKKS